MKEKLERDRGIRRNRKLEKRERGELGRNNEVKET